MIMIFEYEISSNYLSRRFFTKIDSSLSLIIGNSDWISAIHALIYVPWLCCSQLQDIASKILLFAQQRPRALCIMSAHGTVSAVTLTQPESSHDSVTYEVKLRNTFFFNSILQRRKFVLLLAEIVISLTLSFSFPLRRQ